MVARQERGGRAGRGDTRRAAKSEPIFVLKLEAEVEEKKFELDELSLQSRLATVNDTRPIAVDLDDGMAGKTVSREFFSARYGGSSQSVFPQIGPARKALHDLEHVAFFKRDWNPELPMRPGEHGLAFCRHPGIDGFMPLFIRRAEHSWLYMGEYTIRKVDSLTPEEWRRQSAEMRNIWLDEGYMKLNWGNHARARYVYRQRHNGYDAETPLELAELKKILKGNTWTKVTRQNMEDALNDGFEQIHVCVLECVGYRADFQRELGSGYEGGSWKTFPETSCRKRMMDEGDDGAKGHIDDETIQKDAKRAKTR